LRIDEAEMLVETVVALMKWHTIFATEPERPMGFVRLSRERIVPAHVGEGMNLVGIASEGTESGKLH
jgi:hypothetical protein